MNILPGTIANIKSHGNLTLVKVTVADLSFTTIVIETPDTASYLKQDASIKVMFKETEVIIAEDDLGISLQNRIPGQVTAINKGALLSQVTLRYQDHTVTSIITTNAVDQLGIIPGSKVVAMVKTNEIMLSE